MRFTEYHLRSCLCAFLTELFTELLAPVYGVASLRITGLFTGFSYGLVNGDFSLTKMFTKPRGHPIDNYHGKNL